MENKSQLKSGIMLSYVNLIVGNLVPLFYTPVMLRILGQSEYGLYSLATSVTSYLSLMSMGISSAVVRYLVKFRAKGDTEGEGKMLGLFSCIFFVIAALTLVVGCVIAFNIDVIYGNSLSATELSKIKVLTVLLSINTALSFAFTVYGAIVIAHERFVFQQVLNIIATILPAFLNILVLSLGFSSTGLVISTLILSSITYVIQMIYCYKKINIKPIFHDMPFYLLKELISFSLVIFIANIANTLYGATDKVIIGAYLGTAATAVYNIGLTFRNIVQSLSTSMSTLLVTKVTTMVDKDASSDELSEVFIKVGRLQFIIVGLAVGGFCAFGREFTVLYAGHEYSGSYFVAVLLMLPMVVPLIQNIGISIITAMNKHRFRANVNIAVAILNLITTIPLVKYWGIIGASFTTFCSNLIGSVALMNWYYYKKIKLNIPLFWKNIAKMAVIPITLTTIAIFSSKYFDYTNPFIFIVAVALYATFYSLLMWPKLSIYEKNLILGVFRKFSGKCSKSRISMKRE